MNKKESVSNKARKPVSNKALGVVFLLIAILIFFVGYIAHLTNTVGFSIMMPDDVLEFAISQIDLYFIEYIIIGFFTGIFAILGLVYLKRSEDVLVYLKKPEDVELES